MEFRTLCGTDLTVSALGYGASGLGNMFGPIDDSVGMLAVQTALDLGINFIDVSPYYGETKAERVLGQALRGIPRDSYVLATKVGRLGDDDFDFSGDRVRRSVDESMRRLGVDHLDLVQCHDIEFGSVDQILQETLPALEELKCSGRVRYVGVTGYPLRIMAEIAEAGVIDTVLSYCRLTLVDRSLTEWLPRFAGAHVGVINASPLAMGLLTEAGPPPWHPAPVALRDATRTAARLCKEQGADLAKLALQFSVAQEGPATTVVGSAEPDNLRRSVSWLAEDLDRELLHRVQEVLSPVLNMAWPSGRPVNADSQP